MLIETPSVKFIQAKLKAGKADLKLQFAAKTVREPGTLLTKAESRDAPTYWLSKSLVKDSTTKFILVCIDLDPPFPSAPFFGPGAHSLQTDLQVSGEPDGDGFVKLESSVSPIIPYVGAGPPPLSAPHRYYFMIWEQPSAVEAVKLKLDLGYKGEVKLTGRVLWDEVAFEAKAGLSDKPLAGTFYTAKF
jgi:phosphatidylethanolamine-binding protein (PEBP) family uncharacterized protein